MNLLGLILLTAAQFLCGRGTIGMFRIQLKPLAMFCLSVITGAALVSFLPVALEVLRIPITAASAGASVAILTVLLNITQIGKYDYSIFGKLRLKIPPPYELVFIALFICLMIPAVWRSYFYPPYARDMLSGPEAMAEFAVREGRIINSIFTVDLSSTNNHLKPPFIMGLQIIYKLLVHPFGQVWLAIMACCFLIWLYNIIREKLHPVIAGVVMLFFISIPELYAYANVLLFDYANMIFFFAGFYFLSLYAHNNLYKYFLFSAFLFGIATYIRLETLVIVGLAVPLVLYIFYRNKMKPAKMAVSIAILLGFSYLLYFLWVNVFVKYYIPAKFDISQQVNLSAGMLTVFFNKLKEVSGRYLYGSDAYPLYGYFLYFVYAVILADVIFYRRSFNKEGLIALYGVLIVYFAMPLLGALIPWFDVRNTTKRGLFKLFALAVFYMRNSGLLLMLSSRLYHYEQGNGNIKEKPEPARQPQPQAARPLQSHKKSKKKR